MLHVAEVSISEIEDRINKLDRSNPGFQQELAGLQLDKKELRKERQQLLSTWDKLVSPKSGGGLVPPASTDKFSCSHRPIGPRATWCVHAFPICRLHSWLISTVALAPGAGYPLCMLRLCVCLFVLQGRRMVQQVRVEGMSW